MRTPVKLLLASTNAGKLSEYRTLAIGRDIVVDLLPQFQNIPGFPEDAPTFAENAAGKALHYSKHFRGDRDGIVFADDSGLVVPSLGGAPGVHSARYAGPNATDSERVAKLLGELRGKDGDTRLAHFVCVVAAAREGRMLAIFSDLAEGTITEEPRGRNGFGYDPVFYSAERAKTFAELNETEKNEISHRGKALRKLMEYVISPGRSHLG
ncbi:MAG TPA: RdgB/HAM1 family non-canonical purine NTP pyrophosphatase [Candidatus Acidoferrales bacterium]|nr:RdgB/HAM1 family non-canonical purine NTP pyrophosphatase [Candidatus Acidoferrales bacterium]